MSSRKAYSWLLSRVTKQVPLRPAPWTSITSRSTRPTLLPTSRNPITHSRYLSSSPRTSKQAPSPTSDVDSAQDIKPYDFDSLSALVSKPSPSHTIIDVREPAEVAQSGRVPGAQNMPINSAPDGLFLPAEEFEDRFGFEKPTADTEVVFYCKAGVRSRAAARVARMAGWQKVGEYPGSWMDWEKKGGAVEK